MPRFSDFQTGSGPCLGLRQAWSGPGRAWAGPGRGQGERNQWEFGNLEVWRPGNLGIWRSGDLENQKLGIQKILKITDLKIRIRSAQNVGKVWNSQKNTSRAPFGAIPGHFLHGPKKSKMYNICIFSLVDPNRCHQTYIQ